MNCEVRSMDYTEQDMKDYYYTAVRMNTRVDFKVIREMFDLGVVNTHRDLYGMDEKTLSDIGGYGLCDRSLERIKDWIEERDRILKVCDDYMRTGSQNSVFLVSCEDEFYPANYRAQSGMPRVLYCKGRKELLKQCSSHGSAAIVGSRNASSYALYATGQFSKELSSKGITVVSGMALGVDKKAHETAVDNPGSTIAILAGGPEIIYPSENRELYRMIAGKGLIISEMPPGQQPLRQYFPSRNRLIAGLSDCTLVMEAGAVSGTLHTASYAAAQGKEVFVLPNNIYFENAEGGLRLLEDGCCVLYSVESVIDSVSQAIIRRKLEFPDLSNVEDETAGAEDKATRERELSILRQKAEKIPDEVTEDEWKVLIEDRLSVKPLDIDNLCHALGLPFYKLSELLISLQMSGRVVLENGKYALTFF